MTAARKANWTAKPSGEIQLLDAAGEEEEEKPSRWASESTGMGNKLPCDCPHTKEVLRRANRALGKGGERSETRKIVVVVRHFVN